MRHCPRCGNKLKSNVKFCSECGTSLVEESERHSCISSVEITDRPKRRKFPVIIALFLVCVIAAISIFYFFGDSFLYNTSVDVPEESPILILPFSDNPTAISEASNSVVMLNCYDRLGNLHATGSGFACFADKIIVTNYHVIDGNAYRIEAITETGNTFRIAYVLATDEENDIAILSTLSSHNLTLLQPGDTENLEKGEKVVAIGSPLGLLNTVSTGVFSGYVNENGKNMLQFTAPISSGSSGGALFDDEGNVLGITFAYLDGGQNLNFAVPISAVEKLLNDSNSADKLLVEQFYDTHPHIYTVDYVMENADYFHRQEVSIEGYISYTYGFMLNGTATQHTGLVASPDDVIGKTFTLEDWDYSTAALPTLQEFDGISIGVYPYEDMDMQEFLDIYTPGKKIVITGVFDHSDVLYTLHITD